MMSETVSKFAQDIILPKARDMDEAEAMDPAVVEQLFEQGLMGIEIPEDYGGSGMNFTSAIIAIEELARVDPSVSVMCDVHNTLCNTAIMKFGSEKLKKEWLPRLATNTVGMFWSCHLVMKATRADKCRIILSVRTSLRLRCFRARYQSRKDRKRIQDQRRQDVDNKQRGSQLLHRIR
jgi:hypothetical protein